MYKDNVCQIMLEKKSSDKFLYTKLIKTIIWMNILSLHTEFYLKPFYSPFYYHHLDNNIIIVKIQMLKKYTFTYVGTSVIN